MCTGSGMVPSHTRTFLAIHSRTHAGGRSHGCIVQSQGDSHAQTHTGARPCGCSESECDVRTARKGTLTLRKPTRPFTWCCLGWAAVKSTARTPRHGTTPTRVTTHCSALCRGVDARPQRRTIRVRQVRIPHGGQCIPRCPGKAQCPTCLFEVCTQTVESLRRIQVHLAVARSYTDFPTSNTKNTTKTIRMRRLPTRLFSHGPHIEPAPSRRQNPVNTGHTQTHQGQHGSVATYR